jgi:DNA-binding transcriptional regulator YhcF (GntR family)
MKIISIDNNSALPLYKQIVRSIHRGIEKGALKQGDLLPSVNQIAAEFSLARGSVFSAYNELRATGIIDSIPGKGYFVTGTQVQQKTNIFLLFSTFTPYKEIIYNSFVKHLNGCCNIDIYFHHHNIQQFETLIREQAGYYNTFVIMPEIHPDTLKILSTLNQKRVFLLDVGINEYGHLYPGVCQHFEKDILDILSTHHKVFEKYKRLVLVFPSHVRSTGIVTGFKKFTKKEKISSLVVDTLHAKDIRKHDAYIVIDDNDLVTVIQKCKQMNWTLGNELGVISYNETALKSVIADGITTISSDFEAMGRNLADMILNNERKLIANSFILVERQSI